MTDVYVDNTAMDFVQRRRSFYNDNDFTVTTEERRDGIPENLMEDLGPYVGDGKARITVSSSMSSNHEFHKAEAFVSVAVVVNNDLEDITSVHHIIKPFVDELLREDHQAVSIMRDEVLPPEKRLHGPPKGLPPPVSEDTVATPPKKSSIRRPSVAKGAPDKPDFRR